MDCGFKNNSGIFRYRAAAIIIEDGCVLMIKNNKNPYYYSVGGAVHLHESAENAVRREVHEETGVNYEIDRLAFIHENFFVENSVRWHEIALYFLMKPNGIKKFKCNSCGQNGEKEQVYLIPLKDIGNLHLYPVFFKDKLLSIKNEVQHIITYE